MRYKMFISYARVDEDFVKEIQLLLAREFPEIEPVVSELIREGGKEFTRKVAEHLDECQWFMPLLTKNSLTNQWVNQEIGYATGLKRTRRITAVLPVVERKLTPRGRWEPIDTRGFIHRFKESAPYKADRKEWPLCLHEIAAYLRAELAKEPTTERLKEQAEDLEWSGYKWESAETWGRIGHAFANEGNWEKAIESYEKAATLYADADYFWEAGQRLSTVAKILRDNGNLISAADAYVRRAEILRKAGNYSWEYASSYKTAADLQSDVGNFGAAVELYIKAETGYQEADAKKEAASCRRIMRKSKAKIGKP